tara:strand:+ start:28463 stop:28783 length:321 start_codon:yes stop_codon:yes gene_type:complete
MEKDDFFLDLVLYVSIVLKLAWLFLLLVDLLNLNKNFIFFDKNIVKKTENYVHLLFSIVTAILLIYLYNHLGPEKVIVFGKTKRLLFIYGILIFISSSNKFIRILL